MPYTHRFTRDILLDCARRELGMRESVYPRQVASGRMTQERADSETHAMACIVGMLEEYPLKSVAATATRIVIGDLRKRAGFRELILEIPEWTKIEALIVEEVAKSIVYRDPLPPVKNMDLDFSEPKPDEIEPIEFA